MTSFASLPFESEIHVDPGVVHMKSTAKHVQKLFWIRRDPSKSAFIFKDIKSKATEQNTKMHFESGCWQI